MNIELPDGRIIADVPEGTTRAEVMRRVEAATMAERQKRNDDAIAQKRASLQKEILDDMGWGGQFLAGAGSSLASIGRTARVLVDPNYTRAHAKADSEHDRPLEDTSGGFWGGLAGDVALTAVPGLGVANKVRQGVQTAATATKALPRVSAALSGVAPYVGSAAGGAAAGAATTPEAPGEGAAFGAGFGAAGELGGRVLHSAYRGLKATFVDPLKAAGRERILKRTLERYASDPAKAAGRAANPEVLVPGVTPTLAEATMDPGLIQLQRASASVSPEVQNALHEANRARVGAYRSTLEGIEGTEAERAAARGVRKAAGSRMYDDAFKVRVDMENAAPEVQQRAAALLQRPSIKRAIPKAMEDAAEAGLPFDGTTSIRGLHQIKMSLDDEIGEAVRAGKNTSTLEATRDQLAELMDELSGGAYAHAKESYKLLSRPVNQQDIAGELKRKAFPALSEYSPEVLRTRPEQYARALEDSVGTVRRSTGMSNLPLEQAMEPQQLAQVQGIARDMARNTAATEAARVPGSPTAQYMAAQNVLRGFLGPLGLPESALDSQLGKLVSGVTGLPYRWTEPQLQQMLARAMTDPREAARLMRVADDPDLLERFLRPYAAQAGVQLGNQK